MSTEIEKAAGTEVTFYIPDTESLGQLDEMEAKFNLNLKYKSADDWAAVKGKPIRVFYMGLKDIPNEDGELIKCGCFVSQKECFISGQMTLVDAVKNLPIKTPLQLTYQGKKANKSSDGQTMMFDVEKLG